MLLAAGLMHGDCLTITGQTLAEELGRRPGGAARRPGGDPPDRQAAVSTKGTSPVLKGNLAPERRRRQDHRPQEPGDHRPGAGVRRRASGMDAILAGQIRPGDVLVLRYPRSARRAGACRKCWPRPRPSSAAAWARASRLSPTGASPAAPGAWWSATSRRQPMRGGTIALVDEGDRRHASTPTASLAAGGGRGEIERRRQAWRPPAPRYERGAC